jgi:hypothetical protein
MRREYDLSKLRRRPGKVKTDPDAAKTPISIRLDGAVLADLRSEAERLGIPYQTLISSVLHRYVNGELVDPKAFDSASIPKLRLKLRLSLLGGRIACQNLNFGEVRFS